MKISKLSLYECPQSCPTLCDPVDWGPPGSSVQGIFQATILEQAAIAYSRDIPDAGVRPVCVLSLLQWQADSLPLAPPAKSLQSCPTLCDPIDGTQQAPPSLGFSRQEHWRGLPFPSPVHEREK